MEILEENLVFNSLKLSGKLSKESKSDYFTILHNLCSNQALCHMWFFIIG